MAQGRNLECEMSNVIAQPTSQSHSAWSYDKLCAYILFSIVSFHHLSVLFTFFILPTVHNYIVPVLRFNLL